MAINDNIMNWRNIRGEVNHLKDVAVKGYDIAVEALAGVKHLMGFEVSSITEIDEEILEQLKVGDLVIKLTEVDGEIVKHQYRVSYKQEQHGICLSYFDAGRLETVSYDFDEETGHWVYNSTDVFTVEGVEEEIAANASAIVALNNSKAEVYVGNITIEDTDWTDGLQGQYFVYNNSLIGANDVIIVSASQEEGRANYEAVRDLEIIATAAAGSITFTCNTHDAPDTVVLTVAIEKKAHSIE